MGPASGLRALAGSDLSRSAFLHHESSLRPAPVLPTSPRGGADAARKPSCSAFGGGGGGVLRRPSGASSGPASGRRPREAPCGGWPASEGRRGHQEASSESRRGGSGSRSWVALARRSSTACVCCCRALALASSRRRASLIHQVSSPSSEPPRSSDPTSEVRRFSFLWPLYHHESPRTFFSRLIFERCDIGSLAPECVDAPSAPAPAPASARRMPTSPPRAGA